MRNTDLRQSPLAPTLIKLSLPVLAGQACNLLYNLVDTFFISLIDKNDPWLVGSTGLVFPIFFIFMALGFGITGGVSSLVARAIGAGRAQDLDRTAESGLFLGAVLSVVSLAAIYPLAGPLLRLFGGTGRLLDYGLSYLLWLLPVVPFMLLSAVFTGILQGEGRPIHMMAAMIIGTVANIILDPIFIFLLGMGVGGAALATALSNALAFGYLLIVFIKTQSQVKIHWKIAHISLPVAWEIVRVSLPHSLGNLLASLSFIFYNRIMIGIDPYIVTSFTLYSRLEQAALIPVWSLSSGLAAVAGQAAGARDVRRMRQASWTGTLMAVIVSGTLLFLFVLATPWLFRLFQSDGHVLELASIIAPWMAAAAFFTVPVFMVTTVMASAGFSFRSLVLTVVRIYLLNVPACVAGAYLLGGSVATVMACIFVSAVAALAVVLLAQNRFFSGLNSGRLVVRLPAAQAPETAPADGGRAGGA